MKCKNCGVLFEPSRRQIVEVAKNPKRLVFCNSMCYHQYNKKGLVTNPGRFMLGQQLGTKNPKWKGELAGYDAKHDWVRRHWGQPQICEHCTLTNLGSRKHHWANISGEYKRDRSDWLRLCAKCHYKYDGRDKNFVANQKAKIRHNSRTANNKTGYKNVRRTRHGTYQSYLKVDGKTKYLGSYKTPQEAYRVYKEKALELYGYY